MNQKSFHFIHQHSSFIILAQFNMKPVYLVVLLFFVATVAASCHVSTVDPNVQAMQALQSFGTLHQWQTSNIKGMTYLQHPISLLFASVVLLQFFSRSSQFSFSLRNNSNKQLGAIMVVNNSPLQIRYLSNSKQQLSYLNTYLIQPGGTGTYFTVGTSGINFNHTINFEFYKLGNTYSPSNTQSSTFWFSQTSLNFKTSAYLNCNSLNCAGLPDWVSTSNVALYPNIPFLGLNVNFALYQYYLYYQDGAAINNYDFFVLTITDTNNQC